MHRIFFASLAVIALANGCSQAATQSPDRQVPKHTNMLELANQKAQENGNILVAFAESTGNAAPYAVLVSYSGADESDPATCRVQIVEGVAGKIHVVEETDHLLFCSTVADAEVEQKQLSVKANANKISIHEERDKKNSTFEFVKGNSDWVVSKVSFNYPEQNTDTAEIDVIHEEGSFPGSLARTRVSDFDASSANLIRKIIR
jgi:hypothetical protein